MPILYLQIHPRYSRLPAASTQASYREVQHRPRGAKAQDPNFQCLISSNASDSGASSTLEKNKQASRLLLEFGGVSTALCRS